MINFDMMKTKIFFKNILLVVFLLLFCNIYAQTDQDISSSERSKIVDKKVSAEEKALILKAGQDNPAKASINIDPKISADERELIRKAGQENPAKANPVSERKKVSNTNETISKEKSRIINDWDNSQPKPDAPERGRKPRIIDGPNHQPPGKKPDKTRVYYRSDGSNTQPDPSKPKDK